VYQSSAGENSGGIMRTEARMRALFASLFGILIVQLIPSASAYAQLYQDAVSAAAPVPNQIVSSKRVFVSFVGWDNASLVWASGLGDLAIPYNTFYAGLASWGRYQLVATPAESELVFALRIESAAWGSGGLSVVRQTILDTKTGVVLWSIVEPLEGLTSRRSFAYLPTAVGKGLDALKTLVNTAAVGTDNTLK
jgi:hypothetical protein